MHVHNVAVFCPLGYKPLILPWLSAPTYIKVQEVYSGVENIPGDVYEGGAGNNLL